MEILLRSMKRLPPSSRKSNLRILNTFGWLESPPASAIVIVLEKLVALPLNVPRMMGFLSSSLITIAGFCASIVGLETKSKNRASKRVRFKHDVPKVAYTTSPFWTDLPNTLPISYFARLGKFFIADTSETVS